MQPNLDTYGKLQYVLGSKFSRSGVDGYVGIVIKVDKQGKKYYSHTIYQKFSREATSGTGNQSLTRTLHPAVNNILHDTFAVNEKSIFIPLDPDTGEPAPNTLIDKGVKLFS